MSDIPRSKATTAAWIGLGILLVALVWLLLSGSGLLPGDNGIEPIADPSEGRTGQTMNLGAWPWTLIVLVATIILGAAIAWGQYRTRRRNLAEKARTEAATAVLYDEEEHRITGDRT